MFASSSTIGRCDQRIVEIVNRLRQLSIEYQILRSDDVARIARDSTRKEVFRKPDVRRNLVGRIGVNPHVL